VPGKALRLHLRLVDNILRITAAPVCMRVQVLSAHPVDSYWRVSLLLWFPSPSISPEIGIRVIGVVSPSQYSTCSNIDFDYCSHCLLNLWSLKHHSVNFRTLFCTSGNT